MKKLVLAMSVVVLSFGAAFSQAAENSTSSSTGSGDTGELDSRVPLFSFSTDEDSARESLDRISGHIDLGFAAPDQTYDSASHYKPSPFGRQEAAEINSDDY